MRTKPLAVRIAASFMVIFFMTGFVLAQANQGAPAKPAPQAPAQQTGPKKINVAVINLKSSSGVTAGEADLISDRLRGDLFNTGKVNVMERDQMQEILKEQGFQQSGACSNEACMVEMGQLLGVEQLVTGSLGKVGSMFLVNLRVIDVKTAKITKVVSKDIKGSIEDVVGELGPIASELVGGAGSPQFVEKKTEEKAAEPEQPKPEAVVEPPKEEKKEAEPVPDARADRNKNRFGIALGARLFFGLTGRVEYDDFTDSNYVHSYDTIHYDKFLHKPNITRTPLVNYFFQGVLKAGPVMTINIGGGYAGENAEYEWPDYNYKETHTTGIFSFPSLGVNFVKRWFPLKLNVGAFFDLNFLSYSVAFASRMYDMEPYTNDYTLDFFSVNGDFGARAGVEILAGKHVGFNVDFIYCYSAFTTLTSTKNWYDTYGFVSSSKDVFYELKMPPAGLCFGVNFYF
jgi:curli biogenesis system outer membrane secretion channel CsgG